MTCSLALTATLAQADPGGGTPGLREALGPFIPFILILVVFFWMMSRSQKKRDRQRQEMIDSIKVKDRVVTVGGIHGRVVTVGQDTFELRVDDDKDVCITVNRTAVSRHVGDKKEPDQQ